LVRCFAHLRITPAYAGNAKTGPLVQRPQLDHPRVRGEREAGYAGDHGLIGSPPRTRGTLFCYCTQLDHQWITPAYAGNASRNCRMSKDSTDHPRVRGERDLPAAISMIAFGSPPRTRGTLPPRMRPRSETRITPAYAGNAQGCFNAGSSSTDHPRVRGERDRFLHDRRIPHGSPPRTRGTHYDILGAWEYRRITPAYAGNAGVCSV